MDEGQRLTRSPILRKACDTSRLCVTSVLSYPTEDLEGDWVEPSGGDWSPHINRPSVNLEHDGNVLIGWARKSLSVAGAPHTVRMEKLEGLDVLVGTTYFDPSSRASMQAFRMIEDDMLPGTSLEFGPVRGAYSIRHQKSFLGRPTPAFTFDKWRGLGWAHCAMGVNPGALTLTKSLGQVPAGLAKILSDNKIGSEELDPVFRKALSKYLPAPKTVVRVEKAMDSPLVGSATVGGDTLYDDEFDEGEAPPRGGVAALYAKAQAVMEVCDQFEKDMQSSDSPELITKGKKICEKLRALAEEAKSLGDKHDAKLSGMAEGKEAAAEEESEVAREEGDEAVEDEEAADDDVDMEREDEEEGGVFKSIRQPYKVICKAMKVRRFNMADLEKSMKERKDAELAKREKLLRILRKLP